MAKWKGKSRGGVLGYKIFTFFLKNFPLRITYFFVGVVCFYFLIFAPSAVKSQYFYFKVAHGFGRLKSIISVYRNFYSLGIAMIDKILLMATSKQPFTFDFDGEEHLHQMASAGQGGFLIGAHIGNWDVAGNLLKRIDVKINILLMDAEHQQIKEYLEKVMVNRQISIIPIHDDFSHIYEIKNALERKELIVMHGDRFIGESRNISSVFLGMEAKFPAGPFLLALQFGAPVTWVFAMKDSALHYHFYATPPKVFEATRANRQQVLKHMVAEYIEQLEKRVRQYPHQWFNFYKFWDI